jgi:radical SAM protein with 4Fe4S-binding SPASM domain
VIVSSTNPEEDINFWNTQGIAAKVYKKISRGGIIDTGMAVKDETWGCKYDREKEWLHILSTGQVVLCCMDWNREHILGDLNTNSISEVWGSEKFRSLRKNVQHSQNNGFICNRCEWSIDYAK